MPTTYENRTLTELRQVAAKRRMKNYSSLPKAKLISALRGGNSSPRKSPTSPRKSPTSPRKSPTSPRKSPHKVSKQLYFHGSKMQDMYGKNKSGATFAAPRRKASVFTIRVKNDADFNQIGRLMIKNADIVNVIFNNSRHEAFVFDNDKLNNLGRDINDPYPPLWIYEKYSLPAIYYDNPKQYDCSQGHCVEKGSFRWYMNPSEQLKIALYNLSKYGNQYQGKIRRIKKILGQE